MSIEVMKQALEVLEMYMAAGTKYPSNLLEMELAPKAYDALRKAIRQAEKPEWTELTDEDIYDCDPYCDCWNLMDVAHAIEAKLKEKNYGNMESN